MKRHVGFVTVSVVILIGLGCFTLDRVFMRKRLDVKTSSNLVSSNLSPAEPKNTKKDETNGHLMVIEAMIEKLLNKVRSVEDKLDKHELYHLKEELKKKEEGEYKRGRSDDPDEFLKNLNSVILKMESDVGGSKKASSKYGSGRYDQRNRKLDDFDLMKDFNIADLFPKEDKQTRPSHGEPFDAFSSYDKGEYKAKDLDIQPPLGLLVGSSSTYAPTQLSESLGSSIRKPKAAPTFEISLRHSSLYPPKSSKRQPPEEISEFFPGKDELVKAITFKDQDGLNAYNTAMLQGKVPENKGVLSVNFFRVGDLMSGFPGSIGNKKNPTASADLSIYSPKTEYLFDNKAPEEAKADEGDEFGSKMSFPQGDNKLLQDGKQQSDVGDPLLQPKNLQFNDTKEDLQATIEKLEERIAALENQKGKQQPISQKVSIKINKTKLETEGGAKEESSEKAPKSEPELLPDLSPGKSTEKPYDGKNIFGTDTKVMGLNNAEMGDLGSERTASLSTLDNAENVSQNQTSNKDFISNS